MQDVVNFQQCDIAINWSGGLHHAKRFEVSFNTGLIFKRKSTGIEELQKGHEKLK